MWSLYTIILFRKCSVSFWYCAEIVNALFPIRFPYVALDYEQEVETAKSSSAIKLNSFMLTLDFFVIPRRHFMLLKLKSARLKNMKNYNNYLEEGRSEDEAVQLYFQRLTMTTMLRMVVKSRSQKTQGFQNITEKFMELSTNSKICLLSFVVLLEVQEVNKMMLFIGVM
ncbi:unnamed protein product [Brassica rapa]|uniref:Uncharacterized protein n=2 Tax=Brassica TaxID=3705 RepID=A0A8D9GY25_BRACM|nr:unnamed protein product [Brassica napus]CAG7888902.1 unnamed protein product [Brassica rapa]